MSLNERYPASAAALEAETNERFVIDGEVGGRRPALTGFLGLRTPPAARCVYRDYEVWSERCGHRKATLSPFRAGCHPSRRRVATPSTTVP